MTGEKKKHFPSTDNYKIIANCTSLKDCVEFLLKPNCNGCITKIKAVLMKCTIEHII